MTKFKKLWEDSSPKNKQANINKMSEQIVKKLLHAQVIVKPTPINEVTQSGLIIPKVALQNIKPTTGTIIVKGAGTKDVKMDDLNVGDLVMFPEESGLDVEIRGEKVKILPYQLVICVL